MSKATPSPAPPPGASTVRQGSTLFERLAAMTVAAAPMRFEDLLRRFGPGVGGQPPGGHQ
jgi:hypothetical protein